VNAYQVVSAPKSVAIEFFGNVNKWPVFGGKNTAGVGWLSVHQHF
jgi:hypothetical protein